MGEFMRVAIFVLGIALVFTGGASKAFDSATDSASRTQSAAPTDRFITRNTSAWLGVQEGQGRHGALGAMGFVPSSQHPTSFTRTRPLMGESTAQPRQRYNPANIPLPATRTLEDHLLTGFVALMLIAYQLRRKHRFLRPHRFSI
jgi:hypothetical protein